jgi:hypothetical protein
VVLKGYVEKMFSHKQGLESSHMYYAGEKNVFFVLNIQIVLKAYYDEKSDRSKEIFEQLLSSNHHRNTEERIGTTDHD